MCIRKQDQHQFLVTNDDQRHVHDERQLQSIHQCSRCRCLLTYVLLWVELFCPYSFYCLTCGGSPYYLPDKSLLARHGARLGEGAMRGGRQDGTWGNGNGHEGGFGWVIAPACFLLLDSNVAYLHTSLDNVNSCWCQETNFEYLKLFFPKQSPQFGIRIR